MSRDDPIFRLRLPEATKERLKARAEQNRRSLTQEIVEILEEKLRTEPQEAVPDFVAGQRLEALEAELEQLRNEVRYQGVRLYDVEKKI